MAEEQEKSRQEFRAFVGSIGSTLAGGIADSLVDGITNGGRRASDIWRNVVHNLLSQTLTSLANSAISGILSLITGGSGGGGGILSAIVGTATSTLSGSGNPYADFINGGALPPPIQGIPEIPRLASGGFVSKPTLALIGEGGEGEWVIPESKMGAAHGGVQLSLVVNALDGTSTAATAARMAHDAVFDTLANSGPRARTVRRNLSRRR